ncbi:MAG: hypothetical protein C5B59_20085 [Bacteroidetes bacterium]|nr:MAG: hypothetical protein C5B59_20085 [Bacteroidota bacterium]
MKKYSWSAVLGALLFCACKKDNNSPNNQSNNLPKVYTEELRSSVVGNQKLTYNLTYDSKSRLISLVSIPDPPLLKFVYKFQTDNQLTMDLYNSNALSIHENIWLNNLSLIDSTFQYNDTNDTSTEKYSYNASKELVELKQYDFHSTGNVLNQTTDYTYDASGNLVQQVDDLGKTVTYDYYNLVNNLSMGQTYYYQSKNLVKTATSNDNGSIETATHYYTFDSSHRLIVDSAVTTGAADAVVIKTYSY